MIKKLVLWAFVLLATVQIWKTPEFQQFKDESIEKIWDLASDTARPKRQSDAQKFAHKMKYWMENFTANERKYIDKISKSNEDFHYFLKNYCYEDKLYHSVLSKENLYLACQKARQIN